MISIKLKETAKNKKGWSLYKLAKKLNMPNQTIYGWSNGRTQPSYENINLLCSTLNCQVNDLFEFVAEKEV